MAGLVVILAASCGEDPSLDPRSVVEGLPAAVVPESPQAVSDVACPDPEPEVVAQTMTCTATIAGDPITIDLDVDEDGTVTAVVREDLLDLDQVAAEVGSRLRADLGVDVAVECPGAVVVVSVDREVRCTGVARGTERALRVRIVDPDGSWRVTFD